MPAFRQAGSQFPILKIATASVKAEQVIPAS